MQLVSAVGKRSVQSFTTKEFEILIEVLIEAREQAGVSHYDLSRRIGRSRTWIYNLEHMGRRVDPVEVRMIALALGLEPLELFKRWLERVAAIDTTGKS